MSAPTTYQTTTPHLDKKQLPLLLITTSAALVTTLAAFFFSEKAMLFSVVVSLLAVALHLAARIVDWVFVTLASGTEASVSERNSTHKRQALAFFKSTTYNTLIRAALVGCFTALAVRHFGVDAKQAVVIATPIYLSLLLAEVLLVNSRCVTTSSMIAKAFK